MSAAASRPAPVVLEARGRLEGVRRRPGARQRRPRAAPRARCSASSATTAPARRTLVKCLSGVHRPDSGEILIDGKEHDALTAELSRDARDRDRLPEPVARRHARRDAELLPQPRARLRQPARARRWADEPAAHVPRDRASICRRSGSPVEARRPVSALSGGQRQMIAVGRAITWGRHIVMLDEPAAALGVRQSIQVLKFVRTMAERGVAVLFISHNMQHVLQATDRIVVLRHGQKVGDVRDRRRDGAADRDPDHRLGARRRGPGCRGLADGRASTGPSARG